MSNIINCDNVQSVMAIAGLVLLECVALFNGIDGAQFGAVIGILGTYAAIRKKT